MSDPVSTESSEPKGGKKPLTFGELLRHAHEKITPEDPAHRAQLERFFKRASVSGWKPGVRPLLMNP